MLRPAKRWQRLIQIVDDSIVVVSIIAFAKPRGRIFQQINAPAATYPTALSIFLKLFGITVQLHNTSIRSVV